MIVVVSDSSLALLAGCVVSRRHGLTLVLVGSCLSLRATRAIVWPLLREPERATWDAAYGTHPDTASVWERPIFTPASLRHPTVPSHTVTAQPLVVPDDAAEMLGLKNARRVSR
jgi:hypothetical protein